MARGAAGHGEAMTVTDPDVPDPLNDPRTLQADPGAYGQGGDLASTEDDAVSSGEEELAAGELAGRFPVSRPAISRHLRVLREAGLVRARSDGRRRLYALDPRPLRELDEWLEPYRDLWAQRLDALDTEIARGRRARTTGDPS